MWKQPENIPTGEWQELTAAWDRQKEAVYTRFQSYSPGFPRACIDGIMAGLLGVYYRTEMHVEQGVGFERQLKDEFQKGYWVDAQIARLRRDYPELRERTPVRYGSQVLEATIADKCMGGIVLAFMKMTSEVCTERFGRPYKDKPKALRNGVLERSSWEKVEKDYCEKSRKYYAERAVNPQAAPPAIFRQQF